MIKEICAEIDNSIGLKADNPKLSELIVKVIADEDACPENFVDMCYEIHEFESYTTSDLDEAKKNNLRTYPEFSDFLIELKEKNIKFWAHE